MKILPLARYIKDRVEKVDCPDCEEPLIFERVNYDHQTLKNGGRVHAYTNCTRCLAQTEVVVDIDPIKKELIEEVDAEENIYKTIFFVNTKHRKKKKSD